MKRLQPPGAARERGAGLVEWVVVTLILTVAIYAILQVIGPDVQQLFDLIVAKLR